MLLLLLLLPPPAAAQEHAGDTPVATWRLLNTIKLDPLPAGRYTQTRRAPDGSITTVFNGNAGVRLARCADATCSSTTPPHTIANTDPNPRFIRMELDGGLPVMVYGAVNDTEAHLTRCHDALCNASSTVVLAKSQRVRHCDLQLADGDGVRTYSLIINGSCRRPVRDVSSLVDCLRAPPTGGCRHGWAVRPAEHGEQQAAHCHCRSEWQHQHAW
jgi:hypothetical protein